jgi:hypothetical protein
MSSSSDRALSIRACGASFSWGCLRALAGTAVLAVVPVSGQGSLGRLVVVGDSLSAGYQNFSLFDSDSAPGVPLGGQKHGYAALVAQQAGANLNLPLISYPGIPSVLKIDASGNITRGTIIGNRENPTVQTFNLSVPGFTLADALSRTINFPVTNGIDAMALDVLGFPGLALGSPPCGTIGGQPGVSLTLSEVACALELQPSTILVSIGNNDALASLIFGTAPTDSGVFETSYGLLLGTLASSGAKIVVSNIPDVTSIPFLVPAPAFQASCHFLPANVTADDFLVPNIADPTQTSFNICINYAIRPASLVAKARVAVAQYNGIIAGVAQQFGVTVVDVNGLLSQISQNGYVVGNRHLTTGFLGGIFSLDGIHPTNTGYAILANAVISSMNSHLNTSIPPVSVDTVASNDPLVFANVAPTSISANFNGTPMNAGSFIWFNANFAASGIPRTGATISLTGSTISFAADRAYDLAVPNALITFSADVNCTTTSFDVITNTWMATVPISGSDEIFLSGLAFPVPASFASGGGKVAGPVTWNSTVASGAPGVSINWKWGAAVYTSFATDYNSLAIKPAHSTACNYNNSDHAGTPEGVNPTGISFQRFVTGGAGGGGGSNFTGGWSGTKRVVPVTAQ